MPDTTIGKFFDSLICTNCEPYAILGGVNKGKTNNKKIVGLQKDYEIKANQSSISGENGSAKQYPKVRITVLSRPFARPFFEDLAPNVGFMEADIKEEYKGVKGLNALYRRLIAKQFTAIADLHSVLRSDYLRMRFNLDNFKVAHIDKHRKGKRKLVASNGKKLVQQPTSFQNYADVFAQLGYPIHMDFTSIYGRRQCASQYVFLPMLNRKEC